MVKLQTIYEEIPGEAVFYTYVSETNSWKGTRRELVEGVFVETDFYAKTFPALLELMG